MDSLFRRAAWLLPACAAFTLTGAAQAAQDEQQTTPPTATRPRPALPP